MKWRLLFFIAFLCSNSAIANITELNIDIQEPVRPGISVDFSLRIEQALTQNNLSAQNRILGIEINYKSEFYSDMDISFDRYQFSKPIEGDEFGHYVFRYSQNLFINTTNMTVTHDQIPPLILSAPKTEFYINSITLILSDSQYHPMPASCRYKLDAVYGSSNPIQIERFSFGTTATQALSNSCAKAYTACLERRYSKRLETCTRMP